MLFGCVFRCWGASPHALRATPNAERNAQRPRDASVLGQGGELRHPMQGMFEKGVVHRRPHHHLWLCERKNTRVSIGHQGKEKHGLLGGLPWLVTVGRLSYYSITI